jgi:hypothetical protein
VKATTKVFPSSIPFDDQLAVFSLFGFDLMSRDELLVVLGPGGSGLEGSRCFKVQRPCAAEIRFVRLIRLECGGSLGQAENTEAPEGGERTEQEVPHQSGRLFLI